MRSRSKFCGPWHDYRLTHRYQKCEAAESYLASRVRGGHRAREAREEIRARGGHQETSKSGRNTTTRHHNRQLMKQNYRVTMNVNKLINERRYPSGDECRVCTDGSRCAKSKYGCESQFRECQSTRMNVRRIMWSQCVRFLCVKKGHS